MYKRDRSKDTGATSLTLFRHIFEKYMYKKYIHLKCGFEFHLLTDLKQTNNFVGLFELQVVNV